MGNCKIFATLGLLAVVSTMISGCDFMRKMAGRPTSDVIEAKRALIEEEKAREAEAAMRNVDDSLADADDSLDVAVVAALSGMAPAEEETAIPRETPATKKAPASKETVAAEASNYKITKRHIASVEPGYYIILGTFGQEENARNKAHAAGKAGYTSTLIPIREGMTAVGICHSSDLGGIIASMKKASGEDFCPADAWILENTAQ